MKSWKTRRTWQLGAPEQEYWLSYSDLMAGLLMLFALMLFSALHHYQGRVADVKEIVQVRQQIVKTLTEQFSQNRGVDVDVDPATGLIRFKDRVLFDEGSAVLRPEGKRQLDAFARTYFGVLFGDSVYRGQLDEIIIEGHTNTTGSYMYNLRLSQDRAFAVMQHLLHNTGGYGDLLMRYVSANGRSEVEPIRLPGGGIDMEKSRRIEIRFRLRDEELLRRIMERLELDG